MLSNMASFNLDLLWLLVITHLASLRSKCAHFENLFSSVICGCMFEGMNHALEEQKTIDHKIMA